MLQGSARALMQSKSFLSLKETANLHKLVLEAMDSLIEAQLFLLDFLTSLEPKIKAVVDRANSFEGKISSLKDKSFK